MKIQHQIVKAREKECNRNWYSSSLTSHHVSPFCGGGDINSYSMSRITKKKVKKNNKKNIKQNNKKTERRTSKK